MILNEINKQVIISFGLGMTMLSCDVGDDVTIYVNGIYNQDEFSIEQDEIDDLIGFKYSRASNGEIVTKRLNSIGIFNDKPVYFINIDNDVLGSHEGGDGFGYVVYQAAITNRPARWVFCEIFTFVNGVEAPFYSTLINNLEEPIYGFNWNVGSGVGSTDFKMLKSFLVVNVQGFTFPASTSKMIQIGMKDKTTGNIILSNKIELTVT